MKIKQKNILNTKAIWHGKNYKTVKINKFKECLKTNIKEYKEYPVENISNNNQNFLDRSCKLPEEIRNNNDFEEIHKLLKKFHLQNISGKERFKFSIKNGLFKCSSWEIFFEQNDVKINIANINIKSEKIVRNNLPALKKNLDKISFHLKEVVFF